MTIRTLIATVVVTLSAAPAIALAGASSSMDRVHVRSVTAYDSLGPRNEAWGSVVPASSVSRQSVIAELRAAQDAGRHASAGEAHGRFEAADFQSNRSRAQALAEARSRDRGMTASFYIGS